MGKKLAIKGHPTRGKEVIELLEMLGGDNSDTQCRGIAVDFYYYIDTYGCINYEDCFIVDEAEFFTLDEFWEKFPFKIGDKVIDEADGCPGVVCEMKWDEDVSDMKYCVAFGNGIDFGWFANDSINYFKIKKDENLEETQSNQECDELRMPLNDNENKFPSFEPMFKMNDELEYKIPDGYEITEVSKDKVFIKPIKSKYPTTYAECKEMLDENVYYGFSVLMTLQNLIICRNAYWKIAGEEMGLGKSWEPDWNHVNRKYYCIYNSKNNIVKNVIYSENKILAFPTEEMRDAFYENFKNEIEQCKELL